LERKLDTKLEIDVFNEAGNPNYGLDRGQVAAGLSVATGFFAAAHP
jgi:hypothetical protein